MLDDYEDEEEEDRDNGKHDDDENTDEKVEYVTHIYHLMLGLLFEIHLPKQCSIIGELGQVGIGDAF